MNRWMHKYYIIIIIIIINWWIRRISRNMIRMNSLNVIWRLLCWGIQQSGSPSNSTRYQDRLVERFLLNDFEERQMSTYALTMYRHNATLDNKVYKVGMFQCIISHRHLGYCWVGVFPDITSIILLWSLGLYIGKYSNNV